MKRTNKRRRISACLAILSLLGALCIPVKAAQKSYQWYCTHVKEHQRPTVDRELSFIEDLGGYYIDRRHTSIEDADKVMYLTFDAGYENGNVAKILDVMQQEQVTGAFFILGNLIRHDPDLVRRMAIEGHTVCNHTVRHRDMSQADETAFLTELRELEALYQDLTGRAMSPYYRPPEGKFSRENMESARKNGYSTIFWSFAYADWSNDDQPNTEWAKGKVIENFHNGAVLLLHPTSATNAAILGEVIQEAKRQGYRFASLDELTAQGGDGRACE